MGTQASNASFHSRPSGQSVLRARGLGAAELDGRGATLVLGLGGGGGGGGGAALGLGGGGGGGAADGGGMGVPPTTLGSSTHVRLA